MDYIDNLENNGYIQGVHKKTIEQRQLVDLRRCPGALIALVDTRGAAAFDISLWFFSSPSITTPLSSPRVLLFLCRSSRKPPFSRAVRIMGRPHNADRPNESSSSHSLHSIDPGDDLPPPYTDEPSLPQVAYGIPQALPPIPTSLEIVDSAYALPDTTGNKSTDKVVFTTNPTLSRNSNALYDVARRQIRLPPRPLLYISGSHSESNSNGDKKGSNKVTDFHFKLDLAETLLTGWERNGNTDGNMWSQVSVISDDHDALAYRGTRMPSRTYNAPKSRAIALPTDGDEEALLASDSVDNPADDDGVFNPVNKPIRDLKRWCDRYCEDPSIVKS